MEITIVYEDEKTKVKKVSLNGRFMYTVTYIFDDEGFVEKMIRVYRDGKVESQSGMGTEVNA